MSEFLKFIKKYTLQIIFALIFTYLQVMTNLRLPDYIAKIVNEGILLGSNKLIQHYGLMMIIVTVVGAVFAMLAGFLASKIATGVARDVRSRIFEKIESFSISEFNNFSTASLITRSTNDIQQIQRVVFMSLRLMLIAPLTAVGALQKAIANAPSISWIIWVSVISLFAITATLFIFGIPKFKLVQQFLDKLNLVTRENLTGIRVVRAFNKESREEEKFGDINRELTRLNLFVNRLMSILQPAMNLILNLSVLAILWFAAVLISQDRLQIGNMIAFMQYSMQVITSFLMISIVFILVPRASVSWKRISEVLRQEPSIKDPKKPVRLNKNGQGKVEFKDVVFTYPEADVPVLTGINFVAEPGKITAFIGSTGSGKTTLVNLIPRLYDVSAGQVLLDGIDVRDLKLKDLYSQIGYVPQKGILFSGTIKSNISYGKIDKKTDRKLVEKVSSIAQASEFIRKLEKGYNSEISQGGSNISGGQKQRLSIARALYIKPKVYIFDDSFSALDFKTDKMLRKALLKETASSTVLIVGQRISTIMHADKIIVLDEGKIVGQGTHKQLLKDNKVYKEIAYSQLSEEELKKS